MIKVGSKVRYTDEVARRIGELFPGADHECNQMRRAAETLRGTVAAVHDGHAAVYWHDRDAINGTVRIKLNRLQLA